MTQRHTASFDASSARITEAAMALHVAMRAALDEAVPNVGGARACGRSLGLKRHLGWQVYTMAHTSDHAAVIGALPKARGWQLVMKSLAEAGCAYAALRSVQVAMDRLHACLEDTGVDPATVRAVAAGALDTPAQRSAMLRARANATRANEFLHGVGVQSYLSAFVIGPVGAGGAVGMATATSIHGVRRSRPGAAWPIYYTLEAHDRSEPERGVTSMKHRAKGIPPLVRDLSSPEAGEACLRMHRDGDTQMVELLDRGSANMEPLDLAFLEHLPHVGTLTKASANWKLMFLMTTPAARAVTEVWFHRSVDLGNDPSAMLVSSPNLNRRVLVEHGLERLPLEARAVALERPMLPAALRKHSKVHAEMLARAAKRFGAPLDEFRGFQLSVPNPPWMSMLALKFDC